MTMPAAKIGIIGMAVVIFNILIAMSIVRLE
jgi:hypothetical protein